MRESAETDGVKAKNENLAAYLARPRKHDPTYAPRITSLDVVEIMERARVLRRKLFIMWLTRQRFTVKWWRTLADVYLECVHCLENDYQSQCGKRAVIETNRDIAGDLARNALMASVDAELLTLAKQINHNIEAGLKRHNTWGIEFDFGSFTRLGFTPAPRELNLIYDDVNDPHEPGFSAYQTWYQKHGNARHPSQIEWLKRG